MASKTFNVYFGGDGYYNIDGYLNPALTFLGVENAQTVTFNISATGHPFYIKRSLGSSNAGAYGDGVSGNGIQNGKIVLTKTDGTPDRLYYQCGNHGGMWGTIYVRTDDKGTPKILATTTPAPITTSPPTTTTPSPTTTLPPENPPTTTTLPPGSTRPDRPTEATGSGYGGGTGQDPPTEATATGSGYGGGV